MECKKRYIRFYSSNKFYPFLLLSKIIIVMHQDFVLKSHPTHIHTKTQEPANLKLIAFDWQESWLKGHEYAFILNNIDAYCSQYGFLKLDHKTHPISIYQNPINGVIYFVKGNGIGTDFGFPRVSKKKRYRWKKMNFTTDLPKKIPYVTYVVASAIKSYDIKNEEQMANFRMHAVVLHKDRLNIQNTSQQYILCHVRKVGKKKTEDEDTQQNDLTVDKMVDFYKLFAYLHNFSQNSKKLDHFSS